MDTGEEELYRVLALLNLLGTHQKAPISRLSTYCGAINVGAVVDCDITYLRDADLDGIVHTLVNALTIVSDAICNGIKASRTSRIALAVGNDILGYETYQEGQQFVGEGDVIKKSVENVTASVRRLGRDGMAETDKKILRIVASD